MTNGAGKGAWAKRRRENVGRLQLTYVLCSAALLTAAFWVGVASLGHGKQEIASNYVARNTVDVLRLLPLIEEVAKGVVKTAPYLFLFMLFTLTTFLTHSRKVAYWLHETLFEEFNSDVLGRVHRPFAFDPLKGQADVASLDWIEAEPNSPRGELWAAYHRFTHVLPGQFLWTAVVGRSGSGKSRTTVHWAREVARRATLNEDDPRTRVRRLFALLRLRLILFNRRPDIPWDAGLVVNGVAGSNAEGVRAALAAWRPRRPTLLILDDPDPEFAKAALDGLTNAVEDALKREAPSFRYPVRLFIVNQTLPEQLKLRRRDSEWCADDNAATFSGEILTFADDARLTRQEMRMAISRRISDPAKWRNREEDLDKVEIATRGNPLLVEIAIDDLDHGQSPETMTRSELARKRADRVLTALVAAGVPTPHLQTIAAASLAGAAVRTDLRELTDHFARVDALETAFGALQLLPGDLGRIFPADVGVDFDRHLPPVLPTLIGDAFVRLVIDTYARRNPAVAARALVSAAWRASPGGMIRTVTRFARADHGADDVLGCAVSDLDLVNLDAAAPSDRTRLASDLLAALCRRDAGAPPPSLAPAYLSMLRAAASGVDRAGAEVLRSVAEEFACPASAEDLRHPDGLKRNDRGGPIAALAASLVSAAEAERSSVETSPSDLVVMLEWSIELLWSARCYAIRLDECEALAGRVDHLEASAPGTANELNRARAWTIVCCARSNTPGQADEADAVARRVDNLCAPFAGRQEFELARARAWSCVCYARSTSPGQADEAYSLAGKVDRLCDPFAGGREFELERAQVWRYVCYAHSKADEAGALAVKVDGLCAPFAGDREFELERARAWGHVCFALSNTSDQAGEAGALALQVDRLCAGFAGDREFELERARVWGSVARSTPWDNAKEADAVARKVEEVCAPFAGDREFELERARVWRLVVRSIPREKLSEADALARKVNQLCAPFAGDREFELERARVWRSICSACCETPRYAREPDDLARVVDRLCVSFAGDREFELERVHAWNSVCSFRMLTFKADEAVLLAQEIDYICAPFAGERDFALECVKAWRFACVARAMPPSCQYDEAEKLAGKVDERCASFVGDPEFEAERAQAWRWARERLTLGESVTTHLPIRFYGTPLGGEQPPEAGAAGDAREWGLHRRPPPSGET